MIGLIFFASVAIWFHIALLLGLALPHWFGLKGPLRWIISLLLIPVLFVLPVADHWIGMRQFKELCEREAVVTLSPNWKDVRRARKIETPAIYLNGYIIKIKEHKTKYIDVDTGNDLVVSIAFITYGGFLHSRLGFGLGTFKLCTPPNEREIMNMININQLA